MLKNKLLLSLAFVLFTTLLFSETTSAAFATHTIKKGEQLEEIANLYQTTVGTLLEMNNLYEESDAVIGFVLKLPEHIKPKPVTVEKKEPKKEVKKNMKKETIKDYEVVKTLTVVASAFTSECKGCSGKTASGIDLKKNPDIKLIAVDPKMIPLGTKVWVEGYGIAIAGDTGGSIKGGKIDIFVKTKKIAYNWGRKKVEIKILK